MSRKNHRKASLYHRQRTFAPAASVYDELVWDAQSVLFFESESLKIGENTHLAFSQLLHQRAYPAQAFKRNAARTCAGLLSMAKKVSYERMERACERALGYNSLSYTLIKSILDRELDRLDLHHEIIAPTVIIQHENLRGAQAYQ